MLRINAPRPPHPRLYRTPFIREEGREFNGRAACKLQAERPVARATLAVPIDPHGPRNLVSEIADAKQIGRTPGAQLDA